MYRKVLDGAAKARLANNIVDHLKAGVEPRIVRAAVEYWNQVDNNLGAQVAQDMGLREAVHTGKSVPKSSAP
jgi:catalase